MTAQADGGRTFFLREGVFVFEQRVPPAQRADVFGLVGLAGLAVAAALLLFWLLRRGQ